MRKKIFLYKLVITARKYVPCISFSLIYKFSLKINIIDENYYSLKYLSLQFEMLNFYVKNVYSS